jgi:hypothetical protein
MSKPSRKPLFDGPDGMSPAVGVIGSVVMVGLIAYGFVFAQQKAHPHNAPPVVLQVKGTASTANITIVLNGATSQVADVRLPWTTHVKRGPVTLSAQSNAGALSCSISENGRMLKEATSAGAGSVCRVSATP